MNLWNAVQLYGYGTSEGARKGWEGRERGRKEVLSDRAQRALASYNPVTSQKVQMSKLSERKVAKATGGVPTADNAPFDVIVRGRIGLEVKTILEAGNDKVTMHPQSLDRKLSEMRRLGLEKVFTIAVDARSGTPAIYYKQGLGSFRLGAMTLVSKMADLRRAVA